MMYWQIIQPSPAILCNTTQIQLLVYQFLQHVKPNVDNRCMQSLNHLWQVMQNESIHHQLKECQQHVNNLTSTHFGHLSYMHKQIELLENNHALEISKFTNQTSSLRSELEEYKMKLQELNVLVEKNCSNEANVTGKQISSEVSCEKGATVENLNEGLVHATSVGNSSLVSIYLGCGADPNSAVHLAAHYGLAEIVQLLLDRGADVNLERKNDKWTPLHVAVQYGHLDVVRQLLNKGAVTDVRRSDECSPLYQASLLGNVQIVLMLIEYNASLDLRCENGSTPLHVAVKKNQVNVTSALLEHGANVNEIDNYNRTGLYLAARYGNLEMVKLLIKHKANVHLQTKDGWNALSIASRLNDTQIAKALLEAGADANTSVRPLGQGPLYMATLLGNLELVKLLIQHNANVNLPTKNGLTSLYAAASHNKLQIAEILLGAGADVNISDSVHGFTPLHIAAHKGHLEMVKLLVKEGADVKQHPKKGYNTARYFAIQAGHKQVAEYLASVGG